MRALRSLAAACAIAALLPAAAHARPADVVIVNGPGAPAHVAISPAANDVEVTSSPAAPVHTRDTPPLFGASISLSASNGATGCQEFAIPDGRAIRLDTVIVGMTGPSLPRAWLDFFARKDSSTSLKQELEVPLRSSNTSNFSFTGQLATGFPIWGDASPFSGDGVPTAVRGCIRAPTTGSTLANLTITGTFLN